MIGNAFDLIRWLTEQPPEKLFEIKEKRKRRSLTANAYYWVLVNKLARKLGISDTEVHMQMLRDYGQADIFALAMEVNPSDYFRYFDQLYIDYEKEPKRVIKAYKRSSQMDSAEFALLVQGLRDECEAQEIDVMTPSEVAQLRYVMEDN